MKDCLIAFRNMEWESPAPGIRYKSVSRNNRRIRLVEFSEEFDEEDWCTSGHAGYVLEGGLSVDFDGSVLEFSAGDGIFIPPGNDSRHKASVAGGKKALLVLFEEA